jgi:hypothetical protein
MAQASMKNEALRGRKSVLFICGSMNQTTQMYKIAKELTDCRCCFTPYYCDGFIEFCRKIGLMEFTIIGQNWRGQCLSFIDQNGLELDMAGANNTYDLVLTCQDLYIPKNVARSPGILVQEGMTDPENFMFHVVKRFKFVPRYLASTAATGLSDWYERFCVASDGYAELFRKRGVNPNKIAVTGIPNFDDCEKFRHNDFPHRGHVLVCTSDARETFKLHNRKSVILNAVRIAAGRKLIFKLHPNERHDRARREIEKYAPGSIVYVNGCTEHMVANCDVLITEYSSTAFVGLELGKEVHSAAFENDELRRLLPLQNRAAAANIARVCREVLGGESRRARGPSPAFSTRPLAGVPVS